MADDEKKIVKLPDAKGAKKQATIGDLLESKAVVTRMQQIVPEYANPDRLLRLSLMAIHKTPLLKEANAMSLLGQLMSCASLGFAPNTELGHAYLIPFKNRQRGTVDVQLIIGYKGFIDLMWRAGNVTGLHADVVFPGDIFDYEYGSNMHLKHKPRGGGGEPTDAYAYVRLKMGEVFNVMPYPDVLKIRNKSEAYKSGRSPWITDQYEMAKKTAIRRLVKVVQISPDVSRAATLDIKAERQKMDFQAIAEDPEMIGYDGGDEDAPHDLEEGADAPDHQIHNDDPVRDEGLAKDRSHEAVRKPKTVDPAKQQGRRSFFGEDA